MTYTYKIADRIIEITSIYPKVHDYCKDYRYDGNADFSVTTSQKDIDYEKMKSKQECEKENKKYYIYPDDYLEELAVYRKIAEKMVDYDTILFHGSVIAVDNQAYLFTAKSGTGKSTHSRLWCRYFGDRAVMVNDDKPLLRITNNGVFAYGTPYNGKHHLGNNICVPLKALAALERSPDNRITKVNKSDIYHLLLQQVYKPKTPEKLLKTMQLLDMLTDQINLYILGCNMEIDAAKIAYEGMN